MSRLAQAGESSTGVPGACCTRGRADCLRERRGELNRAHAGKRLRQLWRIAPDEHHVAHFAAEGVGKRAEVLSFALAAGDQHQRTRHTSHGRQGRPDIGALGVIDVAHACDLSHHCERWEDR